MIADHPAISRITGQRIGRLLRFDRLVFFVAGVIACKSGFAQVVLDGKFGTAGPVAGPNYNIASDLGKIHGNNLFQSFSQFNLTKGQVATFTGPANIQNILSRVTGGSPSSIDGTIRSEIAGANFYFINPSGIIFGPNASVDVSGSFAASTANYLKLEDGAKFMAALDADDSTLSSAPVSAFGFLEGANGAIEVRGSLRSAPGSPLTVIGSSVLVKDGASLEALNSQITLTGVSAAGEVALNIQSTIKPGTPSFPTAPPSGSVVIRGGRLVVENAVVDVSETGGDLRAALTDSIELHNGGQLTARSSGAIKGGDVVLEAPKVVIDSQQGPLLTRVAAETASDDPAATGGNVVIRSDSLDLLGGAEISVSAQSFAGAGEVDITTGAMRVVGFEFGLTQIAANAAPISGATFGSGGKITIKADSLDISQYAVIQAITLGDGNAGSIDLTTKSLSLKDSSITTYTTTAGKGGDITVRTDSLSLDSPICSITALSLGNDSALPAGNGGNIDVKADSIHMVNGSGISVATIGDGDAGKLRIDTGSLELKSDATISASTYGLGNGGEINIKAKSMLLDTATPNGVSPGIVAASYPDDFNGLPGGGKGGDINIVTDSLVLKNGMPISAATSTPGNGGNIKIHAGRVSLDTRSSIQSASLSTGAGGTVALESDADITLNGNSTISSASQSTGNAGTVSVKSSGDVLLQDNSTISSASQSTGIAGTVSVKSAGDVLLHDNSTISTAALQSSGGDINVTAGNDLRLYDSSITAQAGPGGGGNISVEAPNLTYLFKSTLTAEAKGDGGNLNVDPSFFVINKSSLNSHSDTQNGGNITILSDYFFTSDSTIDSSAPFGIPGTVTVSAPQVDLSGSLVALPSSLLDVGAQLRPACGVRLTGSVSSFILLGRGGLPFDPGGFVPSGLLPLPDEQQ